MTEWTRTITLFKKSPLCCKIIIIIVTCTIVHIPDAYPNIFTSIFYFINFIKLTINCIATVWMMMMMMMLWNENDFIFFNTPKTENLRSYTVHN